MANGINCHDEGVFSRQPACVGCKIRWFWRRSVTCHLQRIRSFLLLSNFGDLSYLRHPLVKYSPIVGKILKPTNYCLTFSL